MHLLHALHINSIIGRSAENLTNSVIESRKIVENKKIKTKEEAMKWLNEMHF